MSACSIGFVWGYLPGVDGRGHAASGAGLLQRFSVIFDRYPDSCPGVFVTEFKKDQYLGVLQELIRLFQHDSIIAVDSNGEEHTSLEKACLFDPNSNEWYSLWEIRLMQHGVMSCYVEHEPYYLAGGPNPYHDAYVYAFYSKGLDRHDVQTKLFSYANKNNMEIVDVITGCSDPRRSWLKKLMDKIR